MTMGGFFTSKQIESTSRPGGKTYSCAACGLYRNALNPRIKPYGNFRRGIMNIGEAPGEVEDQRGLPWQGRTGQLLQRTYAELGVDLFEDCVNINACHCRPTDGTGCNRPPTNYEVESCRKATLRLIDEYKPKIVVLFGNAALYSLLGHRWKRDSGPMKISKWRGWTIPDQDLRTWICPTFHPSFIERSETEDVRVIWKRDMQQALECLGKDFPQNHIPRINVITDLSILRQIPNSCDRIAIDYETTGLKPHAKGHRIVSASVAISPDNVFVFMMPRNPQDRKPFTDLLANLEVEKMAHNMKFEEGWSVVRLKQAVENWRWDSMQAAHILDNRRGVSGLKFQVYVNFGVIDYDSDVSPYLRSDDEKNANAMNRISELVEKPEGRAKLLEYNALDSIWEYRLAELQMRLIEGDNLPF